MEKDLPKTHSSFHNNWYTTTYELLEDKLGVYFPSMYVPPEIAVGSSVWMARTASAGIALSGDDWKESHTNRSFLHHTVSIYT